jgi:hypothetical protein
MECGMVNYPCAGITYNILGIKDNINLKPDHISGLIKQITPAYSFRVYIMAGYLVCPCLIYLLFSYVVRPKIYYRGSMVGLLDLDIFDK